MKIIISPSKTKSLKNINCDIKIPKNEFSEITKEIVDKIKEYSVTEIMKKFKLNEDKAKKLLEFYKNYENEKSGNSLASYSGIVYKSIDVDSFNEKELKFIEENLIILSALYGVLSPFSNIKEYRLDMVNSIFEKKSLYEIWKKPINEYFKNESIIVNLASKEYSKILDLDKENSKKLINFEFLDNVDGKLKQISTNSKKMRGFTVNYIVKNNIQNIEKLRNINLNGYIFDEKSSNDKKFVYIKNL